MNDPQLNLQQVPQLPQRQDSTTHQLLDLKCVAQRLGMYDAADFIQRHLDWCQSAAQGQSTKAPVKMKAHMEMDFTFDSVADGVGEAQLEARRFLRSHILDDEDQQVITIKKFEVGAPIEVGGDTVRVKHDHSLHVVVGIPFLDRLDVRPADATSGSVGIPLDWVEEIIPFVRPPPE